MIQVSFNKICGSGQNTDKTILITQIPAVPNAAETINLKGDPYVVKSRDWVLDEDNQLYAYLRVTPLFRI